MDWSETGGKHGALTDWKMEEEREEQEWDKKLDEQLDNNLTSMKLFCKFVGAPVAGTCHAL